MGCQESLKFFILLASEGMGNEYLSIQVKVDAITSLERWVFDHSGI